MKINPSLVFSVSLLVGLVISLQSIHAEETVIDEKFSAPLSDSWNVRPQNSASAQDGELTLTATADDTAYAVSNVYYAKPVPKLNFTKNSVQIMLQDLAMKGSSDPVNQVFIFALTSDNISETKATSQLRLRIDGSGAVILRGQNKSEEAPFLDLTDHAELPIKKLEITLSPKGAIIAITDANGTHKAEATFDAPPTAWSDSDPFFRFQIQRNPGPGDAQLILRGLSITSSPASASK